MTVTILDDNNSTFGQVRIDRADVRVDTFRASGPGGQHRNKTSSGVRLTHLPSGTVVTAVEDRSQHANRDVAWRRLEARLRNDQNSRAAAAGNQARVEQLEDTTRSWTWTGWRDEVKSSTGRKARMGSVLAGKLGPLLRR